MSRLVKFLSTVFSMMIILGCSPARQGDERTQDSTQVPDSMSADSTSVTLMAGRDTPDTTQYQFSSEGPNAMFMDVQNIEVKGDSVIVSFGVGEGGDEAVLKTTIIGTTTPVAGKEGFDQLAPMPANYDPARCNFTYRKQPKQKMKGERFYVVFQPSGSYNLVVDLERKGDLSVVLGNWQKVQVKSGEIKLPDSPDSQRIFIGADGDPMFVVVNGDSEYYSIIGYDVHNYGRQSEFRLRQQGDDYVVTTEDVVGEFYAYYYTVFDGIFETPQYYVYPGRENEYPKSMPAR